MQLGHSADEIKYDGTYDQTIALYLVVLDGKPTAHIVCDSADPERIIKIRQLGKPETDQATNGRFAMAEVITEDADGMPLGVESRVDEKSVYTYVIPRLHVLLGRLLRAAS